jgi:hypothetical protein
MLATAAAAQPSIKAPSLIKNHPPREALVVAADDEVVAAGVHRERGDGPAAADELLRERLLGQVVHAHLVREVDLKERRRDWWW